MPANSHTHTCRQAGRQAHTHTHMQAGRPADTHTHTHTHTHAHTCTNVSRDRYIHINNTTHNQRTKHRTGKMEKN